MPGSGEEAALVFGALWEPTPGARVERAQEAGGGVEKDQDGWSQCRPSGGWRPGDQGRGYACYREGRRCLGPGRGPATEGEVPPGCQPYGMKVQAVEFL